MGDLRRCACGRRFGEPSRAHARLPHRARRHLALLHPRRRARAWAPGARGPRGRMGQRPLSPWRRVPTSCSTTPSTPPPSTPTTWAGATARSPTWWRSAAALARANRLMLFHHDPLHSDDMTRPARRRSARALGRAAAATDGGDRARRRAAPSTSCRRGRQAPPAQPPESAAATLRWRSPSPRHRAAAARSALVREALEMAREAHAGPGPQRQRRHALHRAPDRGRRRCSTEHGYGEEVLAAALLHDVVEDSETTRRRAARALRRRGRRAGRRAQRRRIDRPLPRAQGRAPRPGRRRRRRRAGDLRRRQADQRPRSCARAYAERGRGGRARSSRCRSTLKLEVWEADLRDAARARRPSCRFLDDARGRAQRVFGRDSSSGSPSVLRPEPALQRQHAPEAARTSRARRRR